MTYDAILYTEAQLVLEVGSFDEDSGDRRTANNVQLHLHLVLQALDTHTHTHTQHNTYTHPHTQEHGMRSDRKIGRAHV